MILGLGIARSGVDIAALNRGGAFTFRVLDALTISQASFRGYPVQISQQSHLEEDHGVD